MRVFKFEELDSTNTFLKNLEEKKEFDTVIAKIQTAGRGRRGNTWISQEGAGLFSFLAFEDTNISIEEYSKLSLIVGYAVLKALKKIEQNLDFKFKWTNDIYLNEKKLCGILIEKVNNFFVIGIGVNINNNNFEQLESIATSLSKETEKKYVVEDIIYAIIEEYKIQFERFKLGQWEKILLELNQLNYLFGKRVKIVGIGNDEEGICGDILQDGRLEVFIGNEIKSFNIGEIHICK